MTSDASAVTAPTHESIKETIESIVVALILAFIFRAFVVEAFVIPTGSMAPTLYGAHGMIVCQDCGTEFSYGLRDLGDTRRSSHVDSRAQAICPNCLAVNTDLKINDQKKNPETGDRILVLKWPFEIGVESLKPARWDVTVFKDPSDGTTNFIKRLVGLPNEVVAIIDGDFFTVPTSELSDKTMKEIEQQRHEKFLLRTNQRDKYLLQTGRPAGVLRKLPRFVMDELDAKMTIARKTSEAQQALWFLVYDHDYPPRTLDRGQPQWKAGGGEDSGWDTSTRRVRFVDKGRKDDYIELAGRQIRASNAYNISVRRSRQLPPFVGDQRVRFVLTPGSAQGSVEIRLHKLGRTFVASIDMNGKVSITESDIRNRKSKPVDLEAQLPNFAVGESVEVSFQNVDYRLTLRIGGVEVLASSSERDRPGYYGPVLSKLRRKPGRGRNFPSAPRLYAAGGDFDFTHLVVERDAYYYHQSGHSALPDLQWAPKSGWASAENPLLLRGHEYFMLGDNTSASKDSRLWNRWGSHLVARAEEFQLGTVPEDQLIGKAFFVYWPSPNRIEWLDWMPILKGSVVPDVGRMRWIR
ncbi:MAG: hypothetical protein IH987_19980 [Planctomycetes bacterium]|nr:hypothetical protein [Planctomycetota bacterium]